MQIKIEIDSSGLTKVFRQLSQKSIAYGMANGINSAALALQEEERAAARSQFVIRSPFFERQIALLKPFASVRQGRPFAELSIGQPPRFLGPIYDRGGERSAGTGNTMAAAPVIGGPARPTFKSKVPQQFRYKSLRLRGKRGERRGARKTFELRRQDGTAIGIFIRTGRQPRDIQMLYGYTDSQDLPDKLDWSGLAARRGPVLLQRAVTDSLARELARAQRR